jgi:hypothetical protein
MWPEQIGGVAMCPEVRETEARNVNDIEEPQFELRGGVIVGGPYGVQTAVFFSSSLPYSSSFRLGFVCHTVRYGVRRAKLQSWSGRRQASAGVQVEREGWAVRE